MCVHTCVYVCACALSVLACTGYRVTGTAARPGSRAGGPQGGILHALDSITYTSIQVVYSLPYMATALNSQIKVADRPVTQQGLAGMKTGSKGTNIHFTIHIVQYSYY